MYSENMIVEYIGGRLYNSPLLEVGLKGRINEKLQIVWDNGVVSLPLTKINKYIKIIGWVYEKYKYRPQNTSFAL